MTSPFLKLFGKSPFRPLCDHIETCYYSAKELILFFDAALINNWEEADKIQHKITDLEHKADEYKKNLRLNLPKDIFLPVARGDLLELVSHQDHIANTAKDIAGLVLGRKMILPDLIKDAYLHFLHRCIDAAKQAFEAVRELNDLYESGFSGKEAEIVEEMIEELHVIEHDTDEMQIKLRRSLFEIEQTLPPVNVMFLYSVISMTGTLADHSQKTGDRLQICIAR
ncbi:MAG: TIGR00153 family protein [Gammaproteobacteria bacterium RIFCSPHIGHO2_12_FULL_35_23]|nr:MAG: TIGR00153 family protein [Gammaproteobacteria bacterium RIFCSPHIGHO2_12_FULL_35_23]